MHVSKQIIQKIIKAKCPVKVIVSRRSVSDILIYLHDIAEGRLRLVIVSVSKSHRRTLQRKHNAVQRSTKRASRTDPYIITLKSFLRLVSLTLVSVYTFLYLYFNVTAIRQSSVLHLHGYI